MERTVTFGEYLEGLFPEWKQASQRHFGRYIDPRETGVYFIRDNMVEFDVEWKKETLRENCPQAYNCLSLNEYIAGVNAIGSLRTESDELTEEYVLEKIKENRFVTALPLGTERFFIDSLDGKLREAFEHYNRWNGQAKLVDILLSRLCNIGGNGLSDIVTREGDAFDQVLEALRSAPRVNELYDFGSRDREHGGIKDEVYHGEQGKGIMLFDKNDKSGERHFSVALEGRGFFKYEDRNYPSNVAQLWVIRDGSVEFMNILSEIVKSEGFYGLIGASKGISRPGTTCGAFYDPDFKSQTIT